ncbi:magnesium chelatase domain-containing protein [Nocardia sp. NBC_01499]|uniref:magnesium chelatase domain-containing protein n=1 Tax=Nocardia sp. NBC_01499 TaxID=2903597 RepID=UPI00386982B5
MNRAVVWSVTLAGERAEPLPVTATLSASSPADSRCTNLAPECRDRVRAALLNSGEVWPDTVVHLSIPRMPRPGGIADLAVGVSILAATGAVRSPCLDKIMFAAEFGLDGSLRSVEGTWAAFDPAPALGITHAVVPEPLLPEFGVCTGVTVVGAPTLTAVLAWLRGTRALPCAGTHRWTPVVPLAALRVRPIPTSSPNQLNKVALQHISRPLKFLPSPSLSERPPCVESTVRSSCRFRRHGRTAATAASEQD